MRKNIRVVRVGAIIGVVSFTGGCGNFPLDEVSFDLDTLLGLFEVQAGVPESKASMNAATSLWSLSLLKLKAGKSRNENRSSTAPSCV